MCRSIPAVYDLRAPAEELSEFIEHYWFVTSTPADPVDIRVDVFVDARADLVFNFEAPYRREVIGGAVQTHANSNLDAQRLEPIRILQRGHVRITGVRFRLGGLAPFVRVALSRFTGRTVPVEDAFGVEAGELETSLRQVGDLDTQKKLLDAFFLRRLRFTKSFGRFRCAVDACSRSGGAATVDALSSAAGVSPRQVDRLFARHLGIPPKTLARVLRFQQALKRLMRDPGCSLAAIATEAGYFDQAHFVKDFRRMSGGVPRGYRGYYPPESPNDFAPNVVVFLQDSTEPGR